MSETTNHLSLDNILEFYIHVTVTDGIYANNTLKDDRYRNEASTNKQKDDRDITPSEKDTSSKSNPYGGSF